MPNRSCYPGQRALRDAARAAYAAQEAAALAVVRSAVPPHQLAAAIARLSGKRMGRGGGTRLEWLRTPPGKHGHFSLQGTVQKVVFLKSLRVHRWNLSAIALPRMKAYAQAVVDRPPSGTWRLSPDQQALKLACFTVITLLELTDLCVEMAGRRVCDLVRHATTRVMKQQAHGAIDLRARNAAIKAVLYCDQCTDRQKIQALQELIPRDGDGSRAALVRQCLSADGAPAVYVVVLLIASSSGFPPSSGCPEKAGYLTRPIRSVATPRL